MKKIIILAFVAIFASIMMMGCEKEKEMKNVGSMVYDQISRYGTIHNQFLDYTIEFFNGEEIIDSLESCLNYLVSFDNNYAQVLLLDTVEVSEMIDYFYLFRNYYIPSNLFEDVYDYHVINPMINQLREYGVISKKDSIILDELLSLCLLQKEGKISIYDYQEEVNELVEEWLACSNMEMVGWMTAIVLNIASSSIQWWIENPEEFKVAPWVASDAVGAVYGATVAGVSSYVQSGQVNWTSVGVGAVSGAVTGSTGVIGKVGKWISKVIK